MLLTQPSVDAEASVFLDPNTLSEDGTIALKDHAFSEDGKLMAYSLSSGGSDWSYIKVCGGLMTWPFCVFVSAITALSEDGKLMAHSLSSSGF